MSATYPDDMGEVVTAGTWMNPTQIKPVSEDITITVRAMDGDA